MVRNLEKGKELKYYDKSQLEIVSFVPDGQTEEIRFMRWKEKDKFDPTASLMSRSVYASRREPFKIAPESQILVDTAKEYGNKVDNNIEDVIINGVIDEEKILNETKLTMERVVNAGLVWADRSIMVAHPTGAVYGEIDELFYCEANDTYYVGDTKTSSDVHKIGYWYQIAMYIEILRQLNPDKNISSIGIINWVKYKEFSWKRLPHVPESEPQSESITPDDPRYNAIWSKGPKFKEPELQRNEFVFVDVEATGVLQLVRHEIRLMNELIEKSDFVRANKRKDASIKVLSETPYEEKSDDIKLLTDVDKKLGEIYNELRDKFKNESNYGKVTTI